MSSVNVSREQTGCRAAFPSSTNQAGGLGNRRPATFPFRAAAGLTTRVATRCLVVLAALSLLACASSPPGAEPPVDDNASGGAGGIPGTPRTPDGRGGKPAEAPDSAGGAPSASDASPHNPAPDAAASGEAPASPDADAPEGVDAAAREDGADGPPAPVGAPACPGKAYKLCEDFEGAAAGGLPDGWAKIGKGGGTIAVATDQFHSGGKALRSESATTSAARVQKSLPAGIGGTHWGRIFYKVQSPAPVAGGVMHITFAALRAGSESRVVDTVESHDGRVQFLYNLPDDSCCRGSSYNWKFDGDWHCAEWYVNAQTKAFRFFYDSTEVTQIGFTANAKSRLTDFTSIVLGVTFYQRPSRPFVAWIDDLAINDTRVGCGP